MFDKLWHDGRIESIDTNNKFYRVVYEDNDFEDMTMQEARRHWVKPVYYLIKIKYFFNFNEQ